MVESVAYEYAYVQVRVEHKINKCNSFSRFHQISLRDLRTKTRCFFFLFRNFPYVARAVCGRVTRSLLKNYQCDHDNKRETKETIWVVQMRLVECAKQRSVSLSFSLCASLSISLSMYSHFPLATSMFVELFNIQWQMIVLKIADSS